MADARVLRDLAEEVEGLSGPSDEMDARITAALCPMIDRYQQLVSGAVVYEATFFRREWVVSRTLDGDRLHNFPVRLYTGSIDAAAKLLPGRWSPEIVKVHHRWRAMGVPSPGAVSVVGFGATEALARTACALRALAVDLEGTDAPTV